MVADIFIYLFILVYFVFYYLKILIKLNYTVVLVLQFVPWDLRIGHYVLCEQQAAPIHVAVFA